MMYLGKSEGMFPRENLEFKCYEMTETPRLFDVGGSVVARMSVTSVTDGCVSGTVVVHVSVTSVACVQFSSKQLSD